jgi:hypothetical protein
MTNRADRKASLLLPEPQLVRLAVKRFGGFDGSSFSGIFWPLAKT